MVVATAAAAAAGSSVLIRNSSRSSSTAEQAAGGELGEFQLKRTIYFAIYPFNLIYKCLVYSQFYSKCVAS